MEGTGISTRPSCGFRVHGAEDLADHLVDVRTVGCAHPFDRVREEPRDAKDIGVFSEEAKDEPRHEVVHFGTPVGGAPFRILFQQFHIEPVQAPRRLDVEVAFADLV